jgi:hypothetical protein
MLSMSAIRRQLLLFRFGLSVTECFKLFFFQTFSIELFAHNSNKMSDQSLTTALMEYHVNPKDSSLGTWFFVLHVIRYFIDFIIAVCDASISRPLFRSPGTRKVLWSVH